MNWKFDKNIKSRNLKEKFKDFVNFNKGYSIGQKLSLLVVSVILPLAVILAVLLFFLFYRMNADIERRIKIQSNYIVKQLNYELNKVKTASSLLSNNPEVVYAAEIQKKSALINSILIFSRSMKIPFITVHNSKGNSLAKSHRVYEKQLDESKKHYVKNAIRLKKRFSVFHSIYGFPIFLSVAPIFSSTEQTRLNAFVTTGVFLDDSFAMRLKGENRAHVFFIYNEKIVSSSLENISSIDKNMITFKRGTGFEEKISFQLDQFNFEAKVVPLKNKDGLYMFVALNTGYEKKMLSYTVSVVLIFFILSIILSYYFAVKLSRKITNPLYKLVNVSKKIAQGDYKIRAAIIDNNEIGHLANAFNCMVEKLQNNINTLDSRVDEKTQKLKQTYDLIKKDLFLARKIQQSIFKVDYKDFTDLDINIYFKPMLEVGGDLYNILKMRDGYYRIFIADATGHGIQAALTTMIIKTEYDKIKDFTLTPDIVLKLLNDSFLDYYYNLNDIFTCAVIDLDIKEQKMYYASAGHPAQFLIKNNKIITIEPKGKMIGILKRQVYELFTTDLQKDMLIFLFTDGIFEEFSTTGEILGETGLVKIIQKYKNKNRVSEIVDSVVNDVKSWLDGEPPGDDITFIGIKY